MSQPSNSKVLTPKGWKYLGDLKEGDIILDGKGKPQKILGHYTQGIKDIYRLVLEDGSTAIFSADHVARVKTGNNQGYHVRLYTIEDLADRVRVVFPRYTGTSYYEWEYQWKIEKIGEDKVILMVTEDDDYQYITDDYIITTGRF